MAKLYFYHAAMNAGKSTMLLQANYNYQERGMRTLVFIPDVVTKSKEVGIKSRIGLGIPAIGCSPTFDFFKYIQENKATTSEPLACVLVDEAQFLTKQQVEQLTNVADELTVPVLTYGLRTDFRGELFEGSYYLLAWADELKEVKTMCHCGKKAIMNMRINEKGEKLKEGPQVQIGGNTMYISTCRNHYKLGKAKLIK